MTAIFDTQIGTLQEKATRLRIESIRATTKAGSGHPTSCASAAEIISTLFFSVMRYDPAQPASPLNDVFILSKGHAAPILYAAWAEAGAFSRDELLQRVWGYRYGDTSTVTVHVRRLREKIEADPSTPRWVQTVWGVGYRFEP